MRLWRTVRIGGISVICQAMWSTKYWVIFFLFVLETNPFTLTRTYNSYKEREKKRKRRVHVIKHGEI